MSKQAIEEMNIYQKLAALRDSIDVIKKDKSGFNYKYAELISILPYVRSGMTKYHLSLLPEITGEPTVRDQVIRKTKTDRTGNSREDVSTEYVMCSTMNFVWVNNDNPSERVIVPWIVTGAQVDPSQAFGSGMTYCTRYFLTSFFQIPTEEKDADGYRSKQAAIEAEEQKEVARSILEVLDKIVRSFLAANEDKKDDVKAFMQKYAKGGNYLGIKDPELAAALLEDFRKKYCVEANKEEE